MKVKKQKFGVLCDGTKVHLYTVSNNRMSFSCTDYGCTLTSIVLTGKKGKTTDVLLGYSTLDGYINSNDFYILEHFEINATKTNSKGSQTRKEEARIKSKFNDTISIPYKF